MKPALDIYSKVTTAANLMLHLHKACDKAMHGSVTRAFTKLNK